MKALHKITDIVGLGLSSLSVHKVRSSLTALGIIIGVCGVMASLAINEGMVTQSEQAFRQRGTDNIVVNSKKPPNEDNPTNGQWLLSYGLTIGDVERLRENIPQVRRAVTVHRTQKYIHVGAKNINSFVIATEPTFQDVARVEMFRGRFLNAMDMNEVKPHCVLTASLAEKLFGTIDDPLGKTVAMGPGDPFVVVGILRELPPMLSGEGGDNDNCAIIPLSTERVRFGFLNVTRSQGVRISERVEVSQAILQMADEQAVLDGAIIARSMLGRYHEKQDFEISVPLEQIRMMKEQKKLLTLVSLGIAAIALVVGGIGIMNIMLASVTERTREIGVRRALGAKRRDVVIQFLVEAVALTLSGGVVGVGVGWLVCWLLGAYVLQFPPTITMLGIFLPFTMAALVGLVSGLYPALRAASLDPITALRHE